MAQFVQTYSDKFKLFKWWHDSITAPGAQLDKQEDTFSLNVNCKWTHAFLKVNLRVKIDENVYHIEIYRWS